MTQKEIKKLIKAFTSALIVTTSLVLLVFLMSWLVQTFGEIGIITCFVVSILLILTSAFHLTSEE